MPIYGTLDTSRTTTTLRKGTALKLDVPVPPERIRISNGLKPYLWALGLTWALPAVVVLVGWVVLSLTTDAPTCQHPTMSCISIEPADGMLILALMFLMPVCAVAGLLAVTVIAVRKAARRRQAS